VEVIANGDQITRRIADRSPVIEKDYVNFVENEVKRICASAIQKKVLEYISCLGSNHQQYSIRGSRSV
jgi:hypothetical protein